MKNISLNVFPYTKNSWHSCETFWFEWYFPIVICSIKNVSICFKTDTQAYLSSLRFLSKPLGLFTEIHKYWIWSLHWMWIQQKWRQILCIQVPEEQKKWWDITIFPFLSWEFCDLRYLVPKESKPYFLDMSFKTVCAIWIEEGTKGKLQIFNVFVKKRRIARHLDTMLLTNV